MKTKLTVLAALAITPAPVAAQANEPSEETYWFTCYSLDWQDASLGAYIFESIELPDNTNEFWLGSQWEDAIAAYRAEQGLGEHDFSTDCGFDLNEANAQATYKRRIAWLPTRGRIPVTLPFEVELTKEAFRPMPQLMIVPATD